MPALSPTFHSFFHITESVQTALESADNPLMQLPMSELKLLHHFTTRTYATLDSIRKNDHLWQDNIVALGFQHPFLMHGILSLSALHLAHLDTKDQASFMRQSSLHLDSALKLYREALGELDGKTCGAYYALACILVANCLGAMMLLPRIDILSQFLDCVALIVGIRTILRPVWDSIMASDLAPMLAHDIMDTETRSPSIAVGLDEVVIDFPAVGESEKNACLEALDSLRKLFMDEEYGSKDVSQVACLTAWPATLSDDFLRLLKERNQLALMVWAQSAVMFEAVSSCWIASGWALKIIEFCQALIDPALHVWLPRVREAPSQLREP